MIRTQGLVVLAAGAQVAALAVALLWVTLRRRRR